MQDLASAHLACAVVLSLTRVLLLGVSALRCEEVMHTLSGVRLRSGSSAEALHNTQLFKKNKLSIES